MTEQPTAEHEHEGDGPGDLDNLPPSDVEEKDKEVKSDSSD
jgi:hypothetical protein